MPPWGDAYFPWSRHIPWGEAWRARNTRAGQQARCRIVAQLANVNDTMAQSTLPSARWGAREGSLGDDAGHNPHPPPPIYRPSRPPPSRRPAHQVDDDFLSCAGVEAVCHVAVVGHSAALGELQVGRLRQREGVVLAPTVQATAGGRCASGHVNSRLRPVYSRLRHVNSRLRHVNSSQRRRPPGRCCRGWLLGSC